MTAPVVGEIRIRSALGRLVIATTVLGSSVAMLTATVVNVALPTLADDLGASASQQQWVVNAYLLTIASLILVGGSLGDRLGRLRIYRTGVVWFALASLACAIAPNVELLIVARLLQGVGGALLTPGSLAIIEASLHRDDRGAGVGRWSGLIGIAGAIGPLLGGLLVDLSWRWVFLLNLPIALVVLVLAVRLPESRDPDATKDPLDLVGAGLTVVALGASSYALIEGPNGGFGVLDAVAAVAAVAAVIGLVVYEPGRPGAVLPLELFADRTFAAANIITFLVYGGMGVVFFLMSIQLQVVSGYSPLAAGAAFLPVTGLMLALSSKAGALSRRIGPRIPLTVGPLLIALGMVLYLRVGPEANYLTDVLPGVIVFGLGLSASVAPVTATALGSVPDSRAGAASGTNNAISRTGQLLAIAGVPPLVGLTGDALSNPAMLDDGFASAMVIGAALVAVGGVLAAVLLSPIDSTEAQAPDEQDLRCCPVDGSVPVRQPAVVAR